MAAPEQTSGENHLRFDEPKFDSDGGTAADRKQSGADHKGSIYAKPDLENGEEYANLVSYIQTYYEGPRRKSVVSMEEAASKKKRPWWKVWQRKSKTTGGEEGFEVPDDVSFVFPLAFQPGITLANMSCSGLRPTSSKVSPARKWRIAASIPASTNSCASRQTQG